MIYKRRYEKCEPTPLLPTRHVHRHATRQDVYTSVVQCAEPCSRRYKYAPPPPQVQRSVRPNGSGGGSHVGCVALDGRVDFCRPLGSDADRLGDAETISSHLAVQLLEHLEVAPNRLVVATVLGHLSGCGWRLEEFREFLRPLLEVSN